MRDMRDILDALHYDSRWLKYGLIDQQSLIDQFSQYQKVDDNREHYRYQSFCKLLDREAIDDVTLERFVELAMVDEDKVMAETALINLIRHQGLTEGQLNTLKSHPAFASSQLRTAIEQAELLRALDASDLNDDLFNRCLANGSDFVQRKVLNHDSLSGQQLSTLAEYGINRAVRNLAKQKLRISLG